MARWLLLACTLLGLAAMHILGHGGSGHGGSGHGGSGHGGSGHDSSGHGGFGHVVVQVPAMDVGTAPCTEDCPLIPAAAPGGPDGDLVDWSVCVAVLSGIGIAVLVAFLLMVATRCPPPRIRWGRRCGPALRAPPHVTVGLLIVSVSVLRT
jgi:hypothetical protein